jgi:DNA-binding LacI/PurR family transcriptional regulator
VDNSTAAQPEEDRPRARRITSADVARASGFSRATVSYVLNDTPNRNISAATRERVRRTAAELGHLPYAPARALRSGRSNIVLALVPGLNIGYVFDQTLEMLNAALAERGYALLVHHHSEEVRPLTELWGLVSPSMVVAMGGLSATSRAALENSRAPLVDVNGIIDIPVIGRMQAGYLIDRGHRLLGFTMPADQQLELFAAAQLEGVRAVCAEHGLPAPSVTRMSLDEESARRAVTRWRAQDPAVTGICAHNDNFALMLTASLLADGLRPGSDLAIVGVDDIPMASLGITTVAVDSQVFGEAIIRSVLVALDEEPAAVTGGNMLSLVVRGSA